MKYRVGVAVACSLILTLATPQNTHALGIRDIIKSSESEVGAIISFIASIFNHSPAAEPAAAALVVSSTPAASTAPSASTPVESSADNTSIVATTTIINRTIIQEINHPADTSILSSKVSGLASIVSSLAALLPSLLSRQSNQVNQTVATEPTPQYIGGGGNPLAIGGGAAINNLSNVTITNPTFTDLSTSKVPEGNNLYYTDIRVGSYVSASSSIASAIGIIGTVLAWNGLHWAATATSTLGILGSQWMASGSNISYTAGNIGIGTTSPSALFTIDSVSATGSILRLSNSSFGGHIFDLLSTGSSNTNGAGRLDIFDSTAGLARLSIAANGNMGVGTTSPNYALDVKGYINTDQNSGYDQGGNLLLYASTTNFSTIVGVTAGGGFNATSSPLYSTAVGYGALGGGVSSVGNTNCTNCMAKYNTAVGYRASGMNTSGGENTAMGYQALYSNSTTTYSTAVGYSAGSQNVAHALTAVGAGAGANVSTGSDNSAFGADAMNNDDSSGFTTGVDNLALGVHSLGHLSSGSFNDAIGNEAMVGCGTWSGMAAPSCLLTGSNNTGVGQSALQNIQGAASENTAIGYSAGGMLTTGTQNIFIGSYTGLNSITTGSLNILIGRDMRAASSSGSNQLNIGNLIQGTGLTQGGAGANGTVTIYGSLALNGGFSLGGNAITSASWNGNSIGTSYGGTGSTGSTTYLTANGTNEMDILNSSGSRIASFATSAGGSSAYPTLAAGGGSIAQVYGNGNATELDLFSRGSGAGTVKVGLNGDTIVLNGTSGNVGIGTTTPGSNLSIQTGVSIGANYGTVAPSNGLIVQGNVGIGTSSPKTSLHLSAVNPTLRIEDTQTNSDNETIQFSNNDGTAGTIVGSWWGGGMIFTSPRDNILGKSGFHFNSQSGTERLTINTGNGNVGIGTTTPYSRLEVWGPDTASTSAFSVVNSASTTEFTVYDTGNATLAGSLVQNSDQRLKTSIQSLDASSSLAAINALNPVSFNWIDPEKGSQPQLGFIAQDIQRIFPSLVSTTSPTALTPDGTLSLNYIDLISPIVSAIQALSREIAAIENTIAGFAQSFTTHQLCLSDANGTSCYTRLQLNAALAGNAQPNNSNGTQSNTATTKTLPIILINGANPATTQTGSAYSDLGASITGPQADLNLGIHTYVNGIATSPVQIDTTEAATDTIDYVVTDGAGNTSTSTRTVIIQAAAQTINSASTSDATTTQK
jgi:hypothetical protein